MVARHHDIGDLPRAHRSKSQVTSARLEVLSSGKSGQLGFQIRVEPSIMLDLILHHLDAPADGGGPGRHVQVDSGNQGEENQRQQKGPYQLKLEAPRALTVRQNEFLFSQG